MTKFVLTGDMTDIVEGRLLSLASGLAFLLVALTLVWGVGPLETDNLFIDNMFWAWMAVLLGTCQIVYHKYGQRIIFNLLASAAWLHLGLYSYINFGGLNFITALALPYCLLCFYAYGFLLGQKDNR